MLGAGRAGEQRQGRQHHARRGSGSTREATELCSKLADALEHAHNAGVVHRDLKPANVMIDADGEPHVMDFGLAKREAGEVTITVEGKMLGTPAYMSPEQAKGTLTTQTVAAIPTR